MNILEIFYILAGITAIASGMPQLWQLYQAKHSEDFNISTWLLWTCTQSVTAAYFFSLKNYFALFVSGAWLVYYAVMICLILYYRQPRFQLVEEQKQQQDFTKSKPLVDNL